MRFLFVFPRAHRVPPLLKAWWALLFSLWCFTAQANDDRITKFVHEFVKDSKGKVSLDQIPMIGSTSLGYSLNSSGGVIGLCYWNMKPRFILLDSKFITYADVDVKALVYHELGHCVGNREHTKGWFVDLLEWLGVDHKRSGLGILGCPNSLMYPSLPSSDCLKNNWEAYVDELFENEFHP